MNRAYERGAVRDDIRSGDADDIFHARADVGHCPTLFGPLLDAEDRTARKVVGERGDAAAFLLALADVLDRAANGDDGPIRIAYGFATHVACEQYVWSAYGFDLHVVRFAVLMAAAYRFSHALIAFWCEQTGQVIGRQRRAFVEAVHRIHHWGAIHLPVRKIDRPVAELRDALRLPQRFITRLQRGAAAVRLILRLLEALAQHVELGNDRRRLRELRRFKRSSAFRNDARLLSEILDWPEDTTRYDRCEDQRAEHREHRNDE
jgi:hypothetical protein